MMQATSAQSAPEAPAPPAAPGPITITTIGADGKTLTIAVPSSQAQVDALVRQRDEISDQLGNVTGRREELVNQIRSAPEGVARTGLEERVKVLDQRIILLESDLASTGRQLAAAPADLVAFAHRETPRQSGGDDWAEGLAFGVFFAFLGMTIVYAFRRFRRRKQRPTRPTELAGDSTQRLERLEQGMEAIAIEIERVAEGQRFVTRLLSESAPLGAGNRIAQPQPVEADKGGTY